MINDGTYSITKICHIEMIVWCESGGERVHKKLGASYYS